MTSFSASVRSVPFGCSSMTGRSEGRLPRVLISWVVIMSLSQEYFGPFDVDEKLLTGFLLRSYYGCAFLHNSFLLNKLLDIHLGIKTPRGCFLICNTDEYAVFAQKFW